MINSYLAVIGLSQPINCYRCRRPIPYVRERIRLGWIYCISIVICIISVIRVITSMYGVTSVNISGSKYRVQLYSDFLLLIAIVTSNLSSSGTMYRIITGVWIRITINRDETRYWKYPAWNPFFDRFCEVYYRLWYRVYRGKDLREEICEEYIY